MINVYVVTNFERRFVCAEFIRNFYKNTSDKSIKLCVVENGTTKGKNLIEFLQRVTGRPFVDFFRIESKTGLSSAWNVCVNLNDKNWTLIANDDSCPTKNWDITLTEHMMDMPTRVFLTCMPNGFSAFAINKRTFDIMDHFSDEFPSGYYEDCNFWLNLAYINTLRYKRHIMNRLFFSFADTYGEGLFTHTETRLTRYLPKWDKEPNRLVFESMWEASSESDPDAIENKNGLWFKKKKV